MATTVTIEEALKLNSFKERSNIDEQKIDQLSKKYKFEVSEVKYLAKNFKRIAPKKIIDFPLWKESLGIMNIPKAEFLAKQIFKTMDRDRDGLVFFEDYIYFTDILTAGSFKQKAKYSFSMLDTTHKGYIEEADVYRMMSSVFEIWNIMTNSKVMVLPEYVNQVFRNLDKDGDNKIDLEEYEKLYQKDDIVFGWFEYLNQDERFLKDMTNKQKIDKLRSEKYDNLKLELVDCIKSLNELESTTVENTQRANTTFNNSNFSKISKAKTVKNISSVSSAFEKPQGKLLSKITKSKVEFNREIRGPIILNEFNSAVEPEGDVLPLNISDDFDFDSTNQNPQRVTSQINLASPNLNASDIDGSKNKIQAIKDRMLEIGKQLKELDNLPINNGDAKFLKEIQIERANNKKNVSTHPDFDQVNQARSKRSKNIKNETMGAPKRNIGLFFGHENWNLMMNMLIGFRAGLKKLLFKDKLIEIDYNHQVRHDINNVTFTNSFDKKNEFIMYEVAPYIFEDIRKIMGATAESYMKSIGPENILGDLLLGSLTTMTELASTGKSGSLFFLTQDSKYYVKTISITEFNKACAMLKDYHTHCVR